MPTDTLFTSPAHWHWLIVAYFFFGGIAGGSYFLSALIDLFGDRADRPLARLGYLVSFPALLLCVPLLVLDLNRPERFWHMMIQANRPPLPIFKWWSPMSVGSWALLIFGAFAFLSFVGSLVEMGVIRWRFAHRLNEGVRRGVLSGLFALVGSAFGFFLASYTGVLLAVTNRPIWANTPLLGLLFVASAGSTAAALLLLLARTRSDVAPASVSWLKRVDVWVLALELLVLIGVLVTLGPMAQYWLNVWGLLLAAVIVGGILLPLLLHWRPRLLGGLSTPAAALLVLVGGLILRAVIVLSAESIEEATAWLHRLG